VLAVEEEKRKQKEHQLSFIYLCKNSQIIMGASFFFLGSV